MGDAPQLRLTADSAAERMLLAAYGEWRHHYEGCAVCFAGAWYEPDFTLRPCRVGWVRFERWRRLGVATNMPRSGPTILEQGA